MARPLSLRQIEDLVSSVARLKDQFDTAGDKVQDLKVALSETEKGSKAEAAIKEKLKKAQDEELRLKRDYNREQKKFNDAVGENAQKQKDLAEKTREIVFELEDNVKNLRGMGDASKSMIASVKENAEDLSAQYQERNLIEKKISDLRSGPTLENFKRLGLPRLGIKFEEFEAMFIDQIKDIADTRADLYTEELLTLDRSIKLNEEIQAGQERVAKAAGRIGEKGFQLDIDFDKRAQQLRAADEIGGEEGARQRAKLESTFEEEDAISKQIQKIDAGMQPVDKILGNIQSSIQGIPLVGDMLGDMVKGPLNEIGASVRDNLVKSMTGKQGFATGAANAGKSLMRIVAKNPIGFIAAAAIGAVLVFRKLNKEARDLANELSMGKDQLDGQLKNLKLAEASFKIQNLDADKLKTTLTTLSSEFKDLSLVTVENAANIEKFAQNAGIGGDEVAKLTKQLMISSGLSFDQALSLQQGAAAMADAAGVASGRVLADMAASAEDFAEFSRSGADGLAEAAVAAANVGLNLDKVLKVAEGLINIETSLTKEFEAQVLTGRVLNLEKARQAAFAGNEQALIAEIQTQVGGIDDFQAMSIVQKQAISEAIGLSVSDIMRLQRGESLDKQDTQISLQKENIDVLRNGFLGNKEELRKLNEKGDGTPGLYGNVETAI